MPSILRPTEAVVCSVLLAPIFGIAYMWHILTSLPIVFLAYGGYPASYINQATGYYAFLDIRYAAPPLGNLRFQAPVPPTSSKPFLQRDKPSRICPQARLLQPQSDAPLLMQDLINGTGQHTDSTSLPLHYTDKMYQETEDCLFLDVFVPQGVFDRRKHVMQGSVQGSAVLVWIHGGGYTSGSKALSGRLPNTLRDAPFHKSHPGVILISINYRLGALGWLSGPSFEAENGTSNVGFLDQRMALQWARDHVHLFGGDKDSVTVAAGSASTSDLSSNSQSSSYASHHPSNRYNFPSYRLQDITFKDFLRFANVSALADACVLPSDRLIAANAALVAKMASYGLSTFGATTCDDRIKEGPTLE